MTGEGLESVKLLMSKHEKEEAKEDARPLVMDPQATTPGNKDPKSLPLSTLSAAKAQI